ncbi:hypothetical protein BAUCODRAFT_150000 [Baudoinia panamericana UAMH 10762]|uniref:Uncharacterized protein n=1 Tax=Baudoinia panamericana (strain UAMH 10762) TaxID=717646 RepID=M2MB83_BAUPA|nr:uncharacterized protein BAUCODRAFT_150000 [Baudoinia panamericana UAMH 10762]EMC93746.1 hypothetical protein BAUCODRAFT_150000 [Baudoinia panamericana UAMH 10762]
MQNEAKCGASKPRIERRRTHTTGRVEGSHLEDARLGRRRSTSTRGEPRAPSSLAVSRVRPPAVSENDAQGSGEERVITRKRSVIPPSSAVSQSQRNGLAALATGHRVRCPQPGYADGSPTPRRPPALTQRNSSLQLSNAVAEIHGTSYGGNSSPRHFAEPKASAFQTYATAKHSIRETQTADQILAYARDECLRDFQQKKVRERKSFILAPFQKRMNTPFSKAQDKKYDDSLPPFNYAGDSTMTPPAPEVDLASPDPLPFLQPHDRKSPNFSESLRGRIKKAFRKASKAPPALPPQHVQAKQYHYPTDFSFSATPAAMEHESDPFESFTKEIAPESETGSGNSRASAGSTADKSRVTSWTNSTAAGTCTSRLPAERPSVLEHEVTLDGNSRTSTLRKAKSFFGRPVQNKLQRSSRAELKSSEDSQGLYSALQKRIKPVISARSASGSSDHGSVQHPRVPSALASLPSQTRDREPNPTDNGRNTATMRTVTPDPAAYRVGICSPVPEVGSPFESGMTTAHDSAHHDVQLPASVTIQRRRANKAPAPSADQLQRRMEKSRNRWKGPLDELSPRPDRAAVEENLYELRSLSHTHQQAEIKSDLPHPAKVGQQDQGSRAAILSPSLYSRGTDGASPRPVTPAEQSSMSVTITGREVKSYAISPPKEAESEQPAQTSGQWRRWLSDELDGFKLAQEDFTLTRAFLQEGSRRSSQQGGTAHDAPRLTSASPLVDARPPSAATPARPHSGGTGRMRASSRRWSFMNERFPMLDTSRKSSDQSVSNRRVPSRSGEHVVVGRASIARMETTPATCNAASVQGGIAEVFMSGGLPSQQGNAKEATLVTVAADERPKMSARRKSAFELRANVKDTSTGRSTPIEIRRKPIHDNINLLEDNTIRNISAGPYASQPAITRASTARQDNNENTPPPGLPAVSSSEWLAAGTYKARKTSAAVHPTHTSRSVSRYSPARTVEPGEKGANGKGSPAQRMASEWLTRRSRESTPAFV